MGDAGVGGTAQGASGAIQLVGGIYQAKALQRQGNYQKSIADMNANLSRLQAVDAQRRGALEAARVQGRGNRMASAERGAFAAGGTDVNSGTAANVQASTRAMSQLDAITISHNAALEAVGYNIQAINQTAAGRFAKIGANNNAAASIATGGMKFANSMVSAADNYNKYRPVVPVTPDETLATDAGSAAGTAAFNGSQNSDTPWTD